MLGDHAIDPKGSRSLENVKQKIEQLGLQWEAYHQTNKNYLAINNPDGNSYFNYMYFSDRDSKLDADSGNYVRGEFHHFFSNSLATMEEHLTLSKTIIETDLNVSLPSFVEDVSALVNKKRRLITDESVYLNYSLEVDGITLNMFHYGTPHDQVYIECIN